MSTPSDWAVIVARGTLGAHPELPQRADKRAKAVRREALVLDLARVIELIRRETLTEAAGLVHAAADGKKVVGIDTPCGAEKELRALALAIEKLIQ